MEVLWEKDAPSDKLYCNTIIFPEERLIIDPSAGEKTIKKFEEEKGWKYCILTHYHGDHRASYYLINPEATYAHKYDLPAIKSLESFDEMVGFSENEVGRIMFEFVKEKYHLKDINHVIKVEDGEEVSINNLHLQIIHTPGHTPGHICVYIKNEDTLYLSDIDLTEFGPWYGNKRSDIDDFIKSIDKVSEIKAKKYLSAHLPDFLSYNEFREKIKRYRNFFFEREERILNVLKDGPKTLDELAQMGIIYHKRSLKKNPALIFFEKLMLDKHLQRLLREGEIEQSGELFSRK